MRWRAQHRAVLRAWPAAILVAILACVWDPGEPLPPTDEQRDQAYLDHLRDELGPEDAAQQAVVAPIGSGFRADIVIAIDTSGSTQEPSGAGDSILAAELSGVRELLGALAGRNVRVAIVSFAGKVDLGTGEQSGRPAANARVVAPLTDLRAAAAAVDEIAAQQPSGGTDFSAALRASAALLCGASLRADVPRIVLLVTDGVPSLPHGRGDISDAEDIQAALDAAEGVAACGGRADVFAVGPAYGDSLASRAVARSGGGSYHSIRDATGLGVALQSAVATTP